MTYKYLAVVAAATALAACSSIGQLTVKNYTTKSGQRVMAGQTEPKDDYACSKIAQEKEDWGFSQRLDKAAAMKHLRTTAVETASTKNANYAYIIIPSETSIMGFNINAFKDAQVAYYQCNNLPPVAT